MSVRVMGWATLAAAVIAAGLATVGCEEEEPRGTNVAATATPTAPTVVPVEAGESAPVVEDVQSVCERADCWPPEDPLDTVEELVREADLIAVVRAEREVESIHGVAGMVISRVELRVESAVAGDATEGDAIVAHLPGGVSAVTGNPWIAGGFKPKAGEPTREERYAESPPFQIGKRELVFFRELEAEDGSLRLYPMHEGRYRFVWGTLAPLFGDQHRLFEKLAPKGIRDVLTGKTLAEFGSLVAPLVAALEAAGPAPLVIRGEGLLADVRTRLANELPHIAAVVAAVESGTVGEVSRLSAFTPFECGAEAGGLFVSCVEAGVARGTMIEMRLLESEAGVFRDSGRRPYASRPEWEARLTAVLNGAYPELVAVLEPPGGGSNLLHLAFRRDTRLGPVSTDQGCFVLSVGTTSGDVLYLHELPTCGAIVDEVRELFDLQEWMMEFWALAPELRDS